MTITITFCKSLFTSADYTTLHTLHYLLTGMVQIQDVGDDSSIVASSLGSRSR